MSTSPCTIIGNVTSDPELKFMTSGAAKLEFSVASNHSWKDGDTWQQKTSFFTCVAWRKTAEDLARVLEKGVGVVVTGRLEQRSWEDKESGKKRSTVELVVDDGGILARSIETFERRRADNSDEAPAKSAKRSLRAVPDSDPF